MISRRRGQAGFGGAGEDSLKRWRDIQAELRPDFERSLLLKEVAPISQNLSALEAAG